MNLYQIKSEITDLIDTILDGGIDNPDAQAALDEHLAGLDVVLEAKADDYAGLIQELLVRSEARAAEARRIRALADADRALADRLKQRLKEAMEATGKLKLETPRFKLAVAGNGGKQPLEVTVDAAALAPQYQAVTVEANKDAIRAALESGAVIPGCTLLARGTSLRIR